MKCNHIQSLGISEEESKQGIENLFEDVMTENFPSLVKEKDTQAQECQARWTERGLYQAHHS